MISPLERRDAAFGPRQRVVTSTGLGENLGDPDVVVGVRQVLRHHCDTTVHVAGDLGQGLHHPGEMEGPVGAPEAIGKRGRELFPSLHGEASHLGQADVAQEICVALGRVDEDVPVGVELEREQPPSQGDWIRSHHAARVVVEPLQVAHDLREPA